MRSRTSDCPSVGQKLNLFSNSSPHALHCFMTGSSFQVEQLRGDNCFGKLDRAKAGRGRTDCEPKRRNCQRCGETLIGITGDARKVTKKISSSINQAVTWIADCAQSNQF